LSQEIAGLAYEKYSFYQLPHPGPRRNSVAGSLFRVATDTDVIGGALWFTNNGADHAYVTIPGASSLMIGQTATNLWTITAWAYEDSNGTSDFVASYGRIMVMDDGTAFQFESGAAGDAQMYTWSRPPNSAWEIGWVADSPVAPLLDQWVHWAVVYDGTNLTVYRNANQGPQGGVASAPVTSPLGFPGYTGAIQIGSELAQPATATWNGMLDDVAVFAGALTQSQIATVMSGNFAPFLAGLPGIVSEPQDQTAPPGATATFSVGAVGQAPLRYQWFFDGTNKLSAVANPTATNATLVLTNVQFGQSGTYSVVVSTSPSSVSGGLTKAAAPTSWIHRGSATMAISSARTGMSRRGQRAKRVLAVPCVSQTTVRITPTSSSPALVH
jgi:hypothetical protein